MLQDVANEMDDPATAMFFKEEEESAIENEKNGGLS
jgi:hypothetical protein